MVLYLARIKLHVLVIVSMRLPILTIAIVSVSISAFSSCSTYRVNWHNEKPTVLVVAIVDTRQYN